jgi:hypothetical protein
MVLKCKIIILSAFIFLENLSFAQPVWEKDQFKIFLKNNVLMLCHQQNKIVEINSFEFNFIKPDRVRLKRKTADSLILKLSFKKGDGFHEDFPSEILLSISQNNNTFHFTSSHKTFNHITIQLKDQNEHYFGLIEKLFPQNLKNPDLRGNIIDLEVYGNGTADYA